MNDLSRADGTRIAVQHRTGSGPTIIFLPGYASDMAGAKATALDDWAAATGRSILRFDYGGCGESGGAFEDQSLDNWLGDALLAIDAVAGPVVLVGSSMGGWIMLLVARARPGRVTALVGIAAAADFTEWGFDKTQRDALRREGRIEEPSGYGAPMVTTHNFWESGQRHLLLADTIPVDVPVRLIHGQRDLDVPWQHSLEIARQLRSDDVQVIVVKDGDHRLSRAADIALLVRTIESLEL